MAAVPADPTGPVPFWQHLALQNEVHGVRKKVERNGERLDNLEKAGAGDLVEIRELRSDVNELKATLNRLIWAVVGMALTLAGSTIGLAIALGAGGH